MANNKSNTEILDEVWLEHATHSDGWETTMTYDEFVAAINKYNTLVDNSAKKEHNNNDKR